MGLDFYAVGYETYPQRLPTPHWSYSGFYTFRHRFYNESGELPADPALRLFLLHSDCDGELSALECGKIAAVIEPIIESWDENDPDWTTEADKYLGQQLVHMMKYCHEHGRELEFC